MPQAILRTGQPLSADISIQLNRVRLAIHGEYFHVHIRERQALPLLPIRQYRRQKLDDDANLHIHVLRESTARGSVLKSGLVDLGSIDIGSTHEDVVEAVHADDTCPGSHLASPEGRPCLLYTSPSPRDGLLSRMPSSA